MIYDLCLKKAGLSQADIVDWVKELKTKYDGVFKLDKIRGKYVLVEITTQLTFDDGITGDQIIDAIRHKPYYNKIMAYILGSKKE